MLLITLALAHAAPPLAHATASPPLCDPKMDLALVLDGSGSVSREDLLVHVHLYSSQGLYADDCAMTSEQLEAVVRATFEQAYEVWGAGDPQVQGNMYLLPI